MSASELVEAEREDLKDVLGQVCVVDVPGELRALGDPDQLRQVFWNLVLNAAEASPEGGEVRVTGRRPSEGSMLELVVADRGRGIPAALLERVFEPFFTTRAKGTGLGLATVHRVVEAHEGALRIESREDEGTSVHVLLPQASE